MASIELAYLRDRAVTVVSVFSFCVFVIVCRCACGERAGTYSTRLDISRYVHAWREEKLCVALVGDVSCHSVVRISITLWSVRTRHSGQSLSVVCGHPGDNNTPRTRPEPWHGSPPPGAALHRHTKISLTSQYHHARI